MTPLGIAVRISKWRATVHYVNCRYYRAAVGNLEIPASMPVRLCRVCRPSEEDVRTRTPEVCWYAYSHNLIPHPEVRIRAYRSGDMGLADDVVARRDLGIGRVKPHTSGWA